MAPLGALSAFTWFLGPTRLWFELDALLRPTGTTNIPFFAPLRSLPNRQL